MEGRISALTIGGRSWRWTTRRIGAWLVGLLWLLAAHLPAAAQVAAAQVAVAQPAASSLDTGVPAYVPGELIVGFYAGEMAAAARFAGLDLRSAQTLDTGGVAVAHAGQPVVAQVLPVTAGQELVVAGELARNPAVAFAHPNWLVYAAGTHQNLASATASPEIPYRVDDPLYADKQWYLQRVQASRAWATAFAGAGASSVRVAIIDSGIDADHPELAGRVEAGRNFVSGAPMVDDCGHGTHVAGLVGATVNDGKGIAGLAPQARLIPYKVLRWTDLGVTQACAGPISGLVSAIYAAVDEGARIINLSLEISVDSDTLRTAVAYAQGKGVLMIGAAGNTASGNVAYPARYAGVMAVAATDYRDQRPFYSNMGVEVEIAAPGGDAANPIFGAWSSDAALRCAGYTVEDGGGYCNASGTSMAAGLVTGAATLLWGMAPGLTADQVRAALRDAATPLDLDPRLVGSGRLNAQVAVRRAVASDLGVSQDWVGALVSPADPPRQVVLRLDNPSADRITWTAALVAHRPWLALASPATGQASYGQPGYVTLLLTPALAPGSDPAAELQIVGRRTDGSLVVRTVPVQVTLTGPASHFYYLPYMIEGGDGIPASAWETPAQPADRTYLAMTDDSNLAVALPFSFPLAGQQFDSARIYSDGMVTFPAGDAGAALPNRCLGDAAAPQQGVYGWWADLNPGAPLAQVSVFQPAAGRYVVEFQDVPTGAGVTPHYTVTFQIVLYADGQIGLNYDDTPSVSGAAPVAVTVGVESRDGRFHNQVTCVTAAYDLGPAPAPGQQFQFQPEEVY